MALTTTTNYSLRKHDAGDLNWDGDTNWNLDKIDTELKSAETHRGTVTGNPHAVTAAQTGAVALLSGDTASRPGSPATGWMYFDTTLGKPVWYDGSGWVDAMGTTA